MKLKTGSGKGVSKVKFSDENKAILEEKWNKAIEDGEFTEDSVLYVKSINGGHSLYTKPVELFGFIYCYLGERKEAPPWIHLNR